MRSRFRLHVPTALVALLFAASGRAVDTTKASFRAYRLCPDECTLGSRPDNWTAYHNVDRVGLCNETMLLDFAVYNPLDDVRLPVTIRACSANLPPVSTKSDAVGTQTCEPATETKANITISSRTVGIDLPRRDLAAAAEQLQAYLGHPANCNATVAFAQAGRLAMGVYSGAKIGNQGAATSTIQKFIDLAKAAEGTTSQVLQMCENGFPSDYIFGVVVDSSLAAVQMAVRSWSDAKCVDVFDESSQIPDGTVWLTAPFPGDLSNSTTVSNSTMPSIVKTSNRNSLLKPRDDCRSIQVVSGDSCGALASKCGITAPQFTQFNPSSSLCSTLQVSTRKSFLPRSRFRILTHCALNRLVNGCAAPLAPFQIAVPNPIAMVLVPRMLYDLGTSAG